MPTEQLTPELPDSGFFDAAIRRIFLILFGDDLKRGLVLRINKFFRSLQIFRTHADENIFTVLQGLFYQLEKGVDYRADPAQVNMF